MTNFKLKPGDMAEIKQKNGEILTIAVYDRFVLMKANDLGTMLTTVKQSDFLVSVQVVKKPIKEKEPKEQTSMKKSIHIRANDEVVQFMHEQFPDRIGFAEYMDFAGTDVLGVKIDIDGLTHSELINAGMSYDESVFLLGK